MEWCQYTSRDFNTLDESKLIVSYPAKGSTAQLRSSEEGLQYIRSNLDIGDNAGDFADDVSQELVGTAVGAMPIKGIGIVNSMLSILMGQADTNSDRAAFDRGVGIVELGSTLDLFNLFYVSSVIEEHGKETEHNFTVYPSFKAAGSDVESTQECVDNFNKNFGDGGKLEIPDEDINIDSELTVDKLQNDFPKVVEMVEKWSKICDDNAWDMEEATRYNSKGIK